LALTTSQEQKVAQRCPVKNCGKTYRQKSHVTRHIQNTVARGSIDPLFAEHKAELDRISPAVLADATDPAESETENENENDNENLVNEGGSGGGSGDSFSFNHPGALRGGVTHPLPAGAGDGVAGGLQLPAGEYGAWAGPPHDHYHRPGASHFQFSYNMEREEPDNPNNLDYLLNTADQAEGLLVPAHAASASGLLDMDLGGTQGMGPAFGGGGYHGLAGVNFGQMPPWITPQSFGNAPPAYTGNIEVPHGGGIRDELAGPQGYGYGGLYQHDV
jgi:hypothetical protein